MNLTIDIGNTQTKATLFKEGTIIENLYIDIFDVRSLENLFHQYPMIKHAILSSVGKYNENTIALLRKKMDLFIQMGSDTPLPIKLQYTTRNTLGQDRIAAAIGANNIYPSQNVLIVDAGSTITFDFVNAQNEYEGGNISPGLQMRYKALHQYTEKLPLYTISENEVLIGKSTEQAIISGVQNGIIFEVMGYIRQYQEIYPNIVIVFTGGNAIFFDKKLKNSIFVNLNLVSIGLNRILEYNAEKN